MVSIYRRSSIGKTGAGHDNEQKKEDRHGHREERNESMKSKKNRNITYMRKHTHKRHKKEEIFHLSFDDEPFAPTASFCDATGIYGLV